MFYNYICKNITSFKILYFYYINIISKKEGMCILMNDSWRKGSFKFLLYSSTLIIAVNTSIPGLAATVEQITQPKSAKTALEKDYQTVLQEYLTAKEEYEQTKASYDTALNDYNTLKSTADETYNTANQLKTTLDGLKKPTKRSQRNLTKLLRVTT